MKANEPRKRPTTSFIVIIFVTLISVIVWPAIMISQTSNISENDNWAMIAFFPIYALLSLYLAYRIYNERHGIAWILVMLVWLSLASVLYLI